MQNTNKIILIDKDLHGSLFSTGFFQFRPPKELVVPKYLYYFLSSDLFLKRKDELCGGSTQKAINDKNLSKIDIFLPPLKEQQRIVTKLDAAFSEIDRAVAANEQLIETSKATFKSHLRQIFQSTPTDWIDSNLKDVAEVFDGPHATPKTVDEGPLFLGISSLQDGELILDKTRHVTEEDFLKWTKRVTPKRMTLFFPMRRD